jgi:hypothetical protein
MSRAEARFPALLTTPETGGPLRHRTPPWRGLGIHGSLGFAHWGASRSRTHRQSAPARRSNEKLCQSTRALGTCARQPDAQREIVPLTCASSRLCAFAQQPRRSTPAPRARRARPRSSQALGDRRMAKGFVRSDIRSRRLVLVRPSSRFWWEVSMQGAEKPHSFADRSLAISYAKMWAAANPPSSVRVLSSTGSVVREWTYS